MTSTHLAYIGLGCNLGEREATLVSAVAALSKHPSMSHVKCSSVYATAPMGPQDQPDYLNAVAAIQTSLDAHELLQTLQDIELDHGRTRDGERWGPRTLDLDLLLYARQIINTSVLTVPHPGISQRSFVLVPLSELDPELCIPGHGPIAPLLEKILHSGNGDDVRSDIRRLDSIL